MMIAPTFAEMTTAAGFATAGLLFGSGYFVALRSAVSLYCRGGGALSAGALTVGRLGAAVGFFALTVHWGAGALIAALAGFLLVRTFAVRAARSRA